MKMIKPTIDFLKEWISGPDCVTPEQLKYRDTLDINDKFYEKLFAEIKAEKAAGVKYGGPIKTPIIEPSPIVDVTPFQFKLELYWLWIMFIAVYICYSI